MNHFLSIIYTSEKGLNDADKKILEYNYNIQIIDKTVVENSKIIQNIGYIQKAVLLSSGYWIALANSINQIENVCQYLGEIKKTSLITAVIIKPNYKSKLFGFKKKVADIPYLWNKPYIANNIDLCVNNKFDKFISLLVKHAYINGCIDFIYTKSSLHKNIKYEYIIRPTLGIILNRISTKLNSKKVEVENLIKLKKIDKSKLTFKNNIPVFINCRDRYGPLINLINWLEVEGMNNIFLIDNNSSYRPLLRYYLKTKHKVIKLNNNMGHRAPWDSGVVSIYAENKPYIVTDPDIIPPENGHGSIKKNG